MSFIHDDFMLQSETAKKLYHEYAENMPIFDYHCHLVPQQIAEDYEFENITELWLGGDHYKWRAMRAMGIPEEKITGNAPPEEKFEAWAYTAENAVGNPLFHWTALELKKYFHIEETLTSANWKEIYAECNRVLKAEKLTARQLIKNSNVTFICTTDNPTDTLEWHKAIAEDETFDVAVVPGFRPDEAFAIQDAAKFAGFIGKMQEATGKEMTTFAELLEGMEERSNILRIMVRTFPTTACPKSTMLKPRMKKLKPSTPKRSLVTAFLKRNTQNTKHACWWNWAKSMRPKTS